MKDRFPNASPDEHVQNEERFKRIVTAFDILKSERDDYNDFLENPEDAYYRYYQYYRKAYICVSGASFVGRLSIIFQYTYVRCNSDPSNTHNPIIIRIYRSVIKTINT